MEKSLRFIDLFSGIGGIRKGFEMACSNPKTHEQASSWKRDFIKSYYNHYGIKLNIPRWSDIVDSY